MNDGFKVHLCSSNIPSPRTMKPSEHHQMSTAMKQSFSQLDNMPQAYRHPVPVSKVPSQ
jgi:hypothetical protein